MNIIFLLKLKKNNPEKINCIFVDEAQFLSKKQVNSLGKVQMN